MKIKQMNKENPYVGRAVHSVIINIDIQHLMKGGIWKSG